MQLQFACDSQTRQWWLTLPVRKGYAKIGSSGSGNVYWLITDGQGSTRDVINNAGGVVQRIGYDAFGNTTSPLGSALTRYLWTGEPTDLVTGKQDNWHRWYNPADGYWMTQDPLGFGGGDTNLYRYVNNSPVNATDPLGEDTVTVISNYTSETDTACWFLTFGYGEQYKNVTSTDQMLSLLEQHVGESGEKIDELNISGHGGFGGINWGGNKFFNASSLTQDQIDKLKSLLAPNATITLYSCSQGAGEQHLGQIQKFSDALGARIWVSPYEVNSGPNTGQWWDQLTRWWSGTDTAPTWIQIEPQGQPQSNDIEPSGKDGG